MEVRKVSQGGQSVVDSISQRGDTPQAVLSTPIKSSIIEATSRTKTDDDNKNELNDKKDQYNEDEIKKAMEKLNGFITDDNTKVEYQYHKQFNDLMIKIVDKTTNQVILEVPPRKILDLVAKMMEMVGVLFDKKA